MAEDSVDGSRLLGDGSVLRTQTGLRYRFREPGTGREVGSERRHPTATGGGGPALDQFPGRAAVLRAQGDAERARDRLTADHFDQRREYGSSSNRGEYRGGPSISPRRLSDSGQEGEGYFPDRDRKSTRLNSSHL